MIRYDDLTKMKELTHKLHKSRVTENSGASNYSVNALSQKSKQIIIGGGARSNA